MFSMQGSGDDSGVGEDGLRVWVFGGMAISRSLASCSGVRMPLYDVACLDPRVGRDQDRGVEYRPSRGGALFSAEEIKSSDVWNNGSVTGSSTKTADSSNVFAGPLLSLP